MFRKRPSDDEMREELEAHVAMRAEHDRVDEAAARRRLGNILHTRESMRRVWIAEWWDALRQDAHYTWRSWRRHPGFALGAILVLALGLGASTALFAALDRVLFRPLPYADPDRLVSVGSVTFSPDGSQVAAGVAESITDTFYVQEWETPPAPFQSVTTMVALVSGASDVRDRRRTAGRSAVRARRAQLSSRARRARCAGPRLCGRRRRARSAASRAHQPCAVGPALRRGSRSGRSDGEARERVIAPAGPHHRRPAARLRDAVRNRRHPAPGSNASPRPEVPVPECRPRCSRDSGRT